MGFLGIHSHKDDNEPLPMTVENAYGQLMGPGEDITAGSILRGAVILDGRTKIEQLTVKLEARQTFYKTVTTYTPQTVNGITTMVPRTEQRPVHNEFYVVEQLLWNSNQGPGPQPLYFDEKSTNAAAPPQIRQPFSFIIPSLQEQYPTWPPSLHNTPMSSDTGNHYTLKFHGKRKEFFKSDERKEIYLNYLPPQEYLISCPPIIVQPHLPSLPSFPPPIPSGPPWGQYQHSEKLHFGVFGKRGRTIITTYIPQLDIYPRNVFIPVYATILTLAPSADKHKLQPPSPSKYQIRLRRHVTKYTGINGSDGHGETSTEEIGKNICDDAAYRVWYGTPNLIRFEGEDKWGCEITIVTEMLFGDMVNPSFEAGPLKLACHYDLEVHMHIEGFSNNASHDLMPIRIASGAQLGQDGSCMRV